MYNLSSLQVVPGAQQVPVGLRHLVGPLLLVLHPFHQHHSCLLGQDLLVDLVDRLALLGLEFLPFHLWDQPQQMHYKLSRRQHRQ